MTKHCNQIRNTLENLNKFIDFPIDGLKLGISSGLSEQEQALCEHKARTVIKTTNQKQPFLDALYALDEFKYLDLDKQEDTKKKQVTVDSVVKKQAKTEKVLGKLEEKKREAISDVHDVYQEYQDAKQELVSTKTQLQALVGHSNIDDIKKEKVPLLERTLDVHNLVVSIKIQQNQFKQLRRNVKRKLKTLRLIQSKIFQYTEKIKGIQNLLNKIKEEMTIRIQKYEQQKKESFLLALIKFFNRRSELKKSIS